MFFEDFRRFSVRIDLTRHKIKIISQRTRPNPFCKRIVIRKSSRETFSKTLRDRNNQGEKIQNKQNPKKVDQKLLRSFILTLKRTKKQNKNKNTSATGKSVNKITKTTSKQNGTGKNSGSGRDAYF